MAACFHHGGGAVASVLVYGGDHVVVVSVFGEYVGDDGECCRVGVFGRVSAAQRTALPDLMHREATSTVTLGRAS